MISSSVNSVPTLIFGTLIPLLAIVPFASLAENIKLRFCYEDKQLLPYYTGNNDLIPEEPGATIEHLQQAAAYASITLELVRLPWLRCLQQLEDNAVDALIASFDETRTHYMVYPQANTGTPDNQKAISQHGLCLVHRSDRDLQQKISNDEEITMVRTFGYRNIPLPKHSFQLNASSSQQALELVATGRVDATAALCEFNGIAAHEKHLDTLGITALHPPIHYSSGYVMFSKNFYQHHTATAEQLWQALPLTLDKQRYLYYLNFSQ